MAVYDYGQYPYGEYMILETYQTASGETRAIARKPGQHIGQETTIVLSGVDTGKVVGGKDFYGRDADVAAAQQVEVSKQEAVYQKSLTPVAREQLKQSIVTAAKDPYLTYSGTGQFTGGAYERVAYGTYTDTDTAGVTTRYLTPAPRESYTTETKVLGGSIYFSAGKQGVVNVAPKYSSIATYSETPSARYTPVTKMETVEGYFQPIAKGLVKEPVRSDFPLGVHKDSSKFMRSTGDIMYTFELGIVRGIREQPVKAVGLFALSAGLSFVGAGVGGAVASKYPAVAKYGGSAIKYTLGGVYVGTTGYELYKTPKGERIELLGRKTSTELIPIITGAKLGSGLYSSVKAYTKPKYKVVTTKVIGYEKIGTSTVKAKGTAQLYEKPFYSKSFKPVGKPVAVTIKGQAVRTTGITRQFDFTTKTPRVSYVVDTGRTNFKGTFRGVKGSFEVTQPLQVTITPQKPAVPLFEKVLAGKGKTFLEFGTVKVGGKKTFYIDIGKQFKGQTLSAGILKTPSGKGYTTTKTDTIFTSKVEPVTYPKQDLIIMKSGGSKVKLDWIYSTGKIKVPGTKAPIDTKAFVNIVRPINSGTGTGPVPFKPVVPKTSSITSVKVITTTAPKPVLSTATTAVQSLAEKTLIPTKTFTPTVGTKLIPLMTSTKTPVKTTGRSVTFTKPKPITTTRTRAATKTIILPRVKTPSKTITKPRSIQRISTATTTSFAPVTVTKSLTKVIPKVAFSTATATSTKVIPKAITSLKGSTATRTGIGFRFTPSAPTTTTPPPSLWFPKSDFKSLGGSFRGGKSSTGYVPSFGALAFKIRGSYTPGRLAKTGLDFRPITPGFNIQTGLQKLRGFRI